MSETLLIAAALGCTEDAASHALPVFRRREVPRGHVFVGVSAECECVWLVLDGMITLTAYGADGQLARINSYGPGEAAGAFPSARTALGELRAEMRTEVLEGRSSALFSVAGSVPQIGRGLATLFANQVERLLGRHSNQITLSASGRVYAELLARADSSGKISPPPVIAALALRVNTSRETASRAVAAAERRGLLRRTPEAMTILSAARLRDLIV
jgi:CRP-like cAMP-binding protein